MKCEICQQLLEEYLDGELAAVEQEQVRAHLITCAACSAAFAELNAEQEIFTRYDRELEVPPFLWTRIAQATVVENTSHQSGWRQRVRGFFAIPSWAGALAMLLIALTVGAVYLISDKGPAREEVARQLEPPLPREIERVAPKENPSPLTPAEPEPSHSKPTRSKRRVSPAPRTNNDQSGVLSTEVGYLDIDERDTAWHIEQTQNLLRSIRNVAVTDGDEEIDVTYDKALSRRLLNENVVLRREAEMKAKFPTKTLLADVEPFLIDIANLPDHARAEDVRVIKERVQKTEIVAALMSYQDRGPNNR